MLTTEVMITELPEEKGAGGTQRYIIVTFCVKRIVRSSLSMIK
jgi:hypothetical protein